MGKRAAAGPDVQQPSGRAVPDSLDRIEALPEGDLASARLRHELLVGAGGVPFEHGIGAQARAHVLKTAAGTRDKLMIQAFVARTAERAREVDLSRGLYVVCARAAGRVTRYCRRYCRGRFRAADPTRLASIPEYKKGAGSRRLLVVPSSSTTSYKTPTRKPCRYGCP